MRLGFFLGLGILGLTACGGGGESAQRAAPPALPSILSFSATPSITTEGSAVQLTASYLNGTGTLTPGNLPIASGTPLSVVPASSTTYTLTVRSPEGAATTQTTNINIVARPEIQSFTASSSLIPLGASVTLDAHFTGGLGRITPGDLSITDSLVVAPTSTTTYILAVTNPLGVTTTQNLTVAVNTTPVVIQSFAASSANVAAGESITLTWQVTGLPLALTLNGQSVLGQTSIVVKPSGRQTYILQSLGANGPDTQQLNVLARGINLMVGSISGGGFRNGPNATARFNHPVDLALTPTGDCYVTESYGTVRKISNGQVSTYFGKLGYIASKNGPLNSALINQPEGILYTPTAMYVLDVAQSELRKITPEGIVSTFAIVHSGRNLTQDNLGNIYVSSGVSCIQKVTPEGIVSLYAGSLNQTGYQDGNRLEARFNFPAGLISDPLGNLYVADANNGAIRKITPEGLVSTIYKASATEPFGAFGIARDNLGNLYIASGTAVRKLTSGGVLTLIAGHSQQAGFNDGPGTSARFRSLLGIQVDEARNLYVCDNTNHNIRKITPEGVVTTFAGEASNDDFSELVAPTTLIAGSKLHILDNIHLRTFENGQLNSILLLGGGTKHCMAQDSRGNFYIADTIKHTILKVSNDQVSIYAGANQAGSNNGSLLDARFNQPWGLAVDSQDNLYVSDFGNHTIRRISTTGIVTTFAGTPQFAGYIDAQGGAARFWSPLNLTMDRNDNLYVSDSWAHSIRKITPAGQVTTLAGDHTLDPGNTDGTSARFAFPQGLTVDALGNVYVADTGNNLIRKITPSGTVSTMAGNRTEAVAEVGALPGSLVMPQDLTFTSQGDLLVSLKKGVVQITF